MKQLITGLKCEHSVDAIGISTRTPRVSWYPPVADVDEVLRLRVSGAAFEQDMVIDVPPATIAKGYLDVSLPALSSLQSYRLLFENGSGDALSNELVMVTGFLDGEVFTDAWIGPDQNLRYSFDGHAFTDEIEEEFAVELHGTLDLRELGYGAELTGATDLILAVGAIGSARLMVGGVQVDDVIQDPPPVDYRVVAPVRVYRVSADTLYRSLHGDTTGVRELSISVLLGNGRALSAYNMPRPAVMVAV